MKKKGPSTYIKYKQVKWKGPCIKSINNENKLCQVYIQPRSLLSQARTLQRTKLGSWKKDTQAGSNNRKLAQHKSITHGRRENRKSLSQGWAWIRCFPGLVCSELESRETQQAVLWFSVFLEHRVKGELKTYMCFLSSNPSAEQRS